MRAPAGFVKAQVHFLAIPKCVLRILSICQCVALLGRWACVQGPHNPGHLLRIITGNSSGVVPEEFALFLHPAVSKAENISFTDYYCITDIIISVGQMLSSFATWFGFPVLFKQSETQRELGGMISDEQITVVKNMITNLELLAIISVTGLYETENE